MNSVNIIGMIGIIGFTKRESAVAETLNSQQRIFLEWCDTMIWESEKMQYHIIREAYYLEGSEPFNVLCYCPAYYNGEGPLPIDIVSDTAVGLVAYLCGDWKEVFCSECFRLYTEERNK